VNRMRLRLPTPRSQSAAAHIPEHLRLNIGCCRLCRWDCKQESYRPSGSCPGPRLEKKGFRRACPRGWYPLGRHPGISLLCPIRLSRPLHCRRCFRQTRGGRNRSSRWLRHCPRHRLNHRQAGQCPSCTLLSTVPSRNSIVQRQRQCSGWPSDRPWKPRSTCPHHTSPAHARRRGPRVGFEDPLGIRSPESTPKAPGAAHTSSPRSSNHDVLRSDRGSHPWLSRG
jgi:hypothetical protein